MGLNGSVLIPCIVVVRTHLIVEGRGTYWIGSNTLTNGHTWWFKCKLRRKEGGIQTRFTLGLTATGGLRGWILPHTTTSIQCMATLLSHRRGMMCLYDAL